MWSSKNNSDGSRDNQLKHALRLYLKEISTIPLLTADEEKALGARIQAGDQAALQKLVESNLRFVVKIAKKYRRFGVSFLDLINEGNLGLIEAAKRFDPSKNVKFISYAIWWIRQSILAALSNLGHPLRLPLKINNTLYKVGITTAKQVNELNRKPTLQEVANDVGITQSELISVLEVGGEAISLNQPVAQKREQVLEDVLTQTVIPSVEQELINRSVKKYLREALMELGRNEQQVLRLRFGLDDDTPRTLKQIGDKIGLSRERVRQIQVKALEKLRHNQKTLSLLNAYSPDGSQFDEAVSQ
jgi:RNA polymerase primary sigma factor